MEKKAREAVDDLLVFLWIMLLASLSIFLWIGSFYVMEKRTLIVPPPGFEPPKLGDEANLLFGAASLALIIFSILLGAVAVVGWNSIKKTAKREIEASTEKRFGEIEKELQGRAFAVMGVIMGDSHSDPDVMIQTDESKNYLAEALLHHKKSYSFLKDLKGKVKFMALNNIVYYSCLYNENIDRYQIMDQARQLKEVKNDSHGRPYLLTYCRAVAMYGSDVNDIEDAFRVGQELLLSKLSEIEKAEAQRCVNWLQKKLTLVEQGGDPLLKGSTGSDHPHSYL